MYKKFISGIMLASFIAGSTFTSCSKKSEPLPKKTYSDSISMNNWKYNEKDDVYYQTGIIYVSKPEDLTYHTLGIFIPGKYVEGTKNSDGTYAIKAIQKDAPYVMPIETPGYAALPAPEDYVDAVKDYTDAGLIFLYSGARGKTHGAPLGVTDFKAAIRYIRHNSEILPGNTDLVFTFGMSGGGAQSAILGASGDSELYEPYLQEIGAVMTESDAVTGSMDWCPITNLNVANEAYEWEMGRTRTDLSEFEQYLSEELALAFGSYIDSLNLKDENGNKLTLVNYTDYLTKTIEDSLNTFLSTTAFPYNPQETQNNMHLKMLTAGMGQMGQGMNNMQPPSDKPDEDKDNNRMPPPPDNKDGKKPENRPEPPEGQPNGHQPSFEEMDGIQRNKSNSTGLNLNRTFNSPEEYIAALNEKTTWVIYDKSTNTAKITSINDFYKYMKPATKNIGAFDDLNAAQGENLLFGYGDGKGAHFDKYMTALLKDTIYYASFAEDLNKKDSAGNTVDYRMNAYNPMYYLSSYYDGYKSSTPAKFWRIRSGICQGDTAISTELMLKLALQNYGNEITDVDFATVWGLPHVEAETTGSPTQNFIAWVKECVEQL